MSDPKDVAESYRALRLSPDSAWVEVKSAYYALAKRSHPDLNPDDPNAPARFIKIHRAFQILKSRHSVEQAWRPRKPPPPAPTESADFAANGDDLCNESAASANQSIAESPWRRVETWCGELWDRVPMRLRQPLEQGWDGAGRAVGEFEKRWLPLDVYTTVTLDARAAQSGSSVKVRTGTDTVEVRVPTGPWSNLHVRIPKKGDNGIISRQRGDLFLNIQILPATRTDAGAESKNHNIQVPRELLARGKVLTLNTHEGLIKFFLPKNTADGQSFVLRGRRKLGMNQPACNHVVKVHLI
jgi:curved DNA-binding protein